MMINILTVAACFIMLVCFRKLDKANLRMAKLRRYSSRVFDEFKKMAEKESRKFQDSTIDMDILIKKGGALAKNMSESITEIENKLKGLDIEKDNLKKTEEDIKVISSATNDVNKQIQYIASVKDNFSDIAKKMEFFIEDVDNLNSRIANSTGNFDDKLRDRSRELTEEFYTHVDNLRRDLETKISDSSERLIESFKIKLSPLIRNVEAADSLNTQISNMKETFNIMENTFFDEFTQKSVYLKNDVNENIDKLTQKLKNVETIIDDSKGKLISTFENEVDKVRTEIDNLSIHAVSKKDEIVQAVRRESEVIRKKIDDFDDKFEEFENKIIDTAEEKINSIDSEFRSIESRFSSMLGRLKEEEGNFSRRAEDQVDILQKSFNDLESRLSELRKINEEVSYLIRTLENAQRESKEFEKFVADIDQIKGLKKVAEKELKTYYTNRGKLSEIEGDIKSLIDLNDNVVKKSDELFDHISQIEAVNAKVDGLSDMYNAVERRIHELHEYEDIISQNLDSVNKSNVVIHTIDNRIKAFEKIVERTDKRIEKIGVNIKNVEAETINLKTKESDIRDLRDRLNALDELSDHLEERVKQIYAMFSKIETIRKEIDLTDNKLQDMFHQTDMKMREFSDFIQAVDKNNPILKQVKGDIKMMPAKNLSENLVKTVRELSKKGWDPEAISKKLMVDENSVRFIINTTSL
ncbi:MAG: hypothetical protein FWH53_10640 [Leptospirales bacterium]|nr:hypothetical protein [Leptospirales bacterium]